MKPHIANMKGKIEAILLKSFAGVFKKLDVTDIAVEIKKEGWYVVTTSPDNTRLCEVLLRRDAWVEYDFPEKVFAVDIDKLYHYAADFRKGEVVEITLEDTAELIVSFSLNGSLVRTFKLPDIEYVRKKPEVPTLEYRIEITLLAPQIKAIKDILATKLGEGWENEVGIGIVERVIRLIEDGYEVEKVTAPPEYDLCLYVADEGIKEKRCIALERGVNYLVIEPCASVYSFDYFKSIFALLTKEVATGTVTIQFAFEYPLKLSYEYKGLDVKILLAPRVDEEKKLTERDVLEELRTPFKPPEEEVEEVETTATTLYFVPTAKGRLLKPFKRIEYSDVELIDILLEKPLIELDGILSHLKLEAIWKETSYDKYGTIVKEEEISREPADTDAIIKIVENYDLIETPYLEIREYYKHPEQLEKGKIELKKRVDTLTRFFFGGFGNYLAVIQGSLDILASTTKPEKKERAKDNIHKAFLWIKRKYEQIPFSELEDSPFYDDFKPLFEVNALLSTLDRLLSETPEAFGEIENIIDKIRELGYEYASNINKYYKELTGKNITAEKLETRALMEYRSKEQIEDQARWLQEHGIEPNSFEKAAMDYFGVVIPEEEPPWRRLIDMIKELEKEHGLEVPEDIAIAAAAEIGIEKPKDLIHKLKADGILYSPAKGLIARVEREMPEEPKYIWEEEFISVGGEILPDETVWLYHATKEETAKEIVKTEVLKTFPGAPKEYGIYFGSNPSVGFDYGDGTVIAVRVRAKDLELDDIFPGRRADFVIEATEYKPVEIGEVFNVREMDPDELIKKYPKTESWVKEYIKEKEIPKERYFWYGREVTKEEYERLKREKEEAAAKAEIEKRIKPLKPLISEAEAAIDECNEGFETCLELCDDDLEACYEECVEKEEKEDIVECNKKCEKERDKCHDKCEEDALGCYDDSAREIIERDIEDGNLTQAGEDLETFMDYISDELYEELKKRVKTAGPEEQGDLEVPEDLELIPEPKIEIGKGQRRL